MEATTTATQGYLLRDNLSGSLLRKVFTYGEAKAQAVAGFYTVERWDENPDLLPEDVRPFYGTDDGRHLVHKGNEA